MKTLTLALAVAVSMVGVAIAQRPAFDRLPMDELNVVPPSARVTGTLGTLDIRERSYQSKHLTDESLRRRIVAVAVQEWSFFGFTVVDYTRSESSRPRTGRGRRRGSLLSPTDTLRVADSIAGYWTVTPEGGWVIETQNERWNRSGAETRWRTPWSAAFVSWVMCESGLSEVAQFRRAVAHHTYIRSGDPRPGRRHVIGCVHGPRHWRNVGLAGRPAVQRTPASLPLVGRASSPDGRWGTYPL